MLTPPVSDPARPVFHAAAAVDDAGEIYLVEFACILPKPEQGIELGASFPKSWRVKGEILLCSDSVARGIVTLQCLLGARRDNIANEAGLKRARAFARRVLWTHAAPLWKNQAEPGAFERLIGMVNPA